MSDRSRPNSVIINLYSPLNKKLNIYKFLMARQQSRKKINLLKIFLLMGGGYEVTLVFFFYVMFIGKVAIGKARCLLNIVFLHLTVQFRPFP